MNIFASFNMFASAMGATGSIGTRRASTHSGNIKKEPSFSGKDVLPIKPEGFLPPPVQVVTVRRLWDPRGENPDRKVVRTGFSKIVYVYDYVY